MEQARELRIIVEHESNGRMLQIDEIKLSDLMDASEVAEAEDRGELSEAISESVDDWARENVHIYASYHKKLAD